MRKPLIRFEDVGFSYESGVKALQGVSFTLHEGEWVAVVGANGSGKSTLARLCNGLLVATEGRVRVGSWSLEPATVEADAGLLWRVRQHVGMVFQNPDNQLVAATVEEDVAFGPENLGLPPAEIQRRVEGALDAVGIQALRHRAPHELSGGQKQLVAIAGVLAMKPRALIFDEATAMLDPRGAAAVIGVVQRLHEREGLTVLWVTHRMEEVAQAPRVLTLHEGRLVADMPPAALFEQGEALSRWGLEAPEVVLLGHALRRRGLPLPPLSGSVHEMVEVLWPYVSAG